MKFPCTISGVKGFSVLSAAPFFNEFVVTCPIPAAQVIQILAAKGIAAGYDLGQTCDTMKNALLVCATELNTAQDIAAYVSALKEI